MPFEVLHAISKRPLEPKEWLQGALSLVVGTVPTSGDTHNVGASRNSLGCQPPCFSLNQRVNLASECRSAFLSAPQVVVSFNTALVALSCPESNIVQPRVGLACPVAHLFALLIDPVLSFGIVVRLVQILVAEVDYHLFKVIAEVIIASLTEMVLRSIICNTMNVVRNV